MVKHVSVPVSGVAFRNHAAWCVGTGRMGLALQKEYAEHLAIVQEAIHFRHIRGHGLFCDDMGIYREEETQGGTVPFYNFTYLDRVMDLYLTAGIRPFLELGFMPEKLKTGDQTVFYWKGNVTPPASYEKWGELVFRTLDHLISRYGREEVVTWPVEVWNEPNIPFWAGTMQEYFTLYDVSAAAVKRADPRMRVGGPAICGVETEKWLNSFFQHVEEHNSPIDFVTRHCYLAEQPTRSGQYIYHALRDPLYMMEELRQTRRIMSEYPCVAALPLHITEFSSSYVPLCPAHDTDFHAAYIARILSEAGDYADSYSYWTFSDVFEEMDVPRSVFHGGFGLVALDSIKKPTFYAFEFFSKAGKELLYRDENLIVTRDGGRYAVIGWNPCDLRGGKPPVDVRYCLKLPSLGGRALLIRRDVGGAHANPLKTWSNMGKPHTLSPAQRRILRASAEPLQTDAVLPEKNGIYELELAIPCNRLCMLEITPAEDLTDTYPGYIKEEFYGMEE